VKKVENLICEFRDPSEINAHLKSIATSYSQWKTLKSHVTCVAL